MTEREGHTGVRTRGRGRLAWDIIFRTLRWIAKHARNAYATFGIFLLGGAAIAVASTLAFAELASHVTSGATQRFDDRIMAAVGANQNPYVKAFMLEVTALGTGTVVLTMVFIAGVFLWLNHHKHSAILLGIATAGGLVLNNLLKFGFSRERPQIFEWGTHAMSSSFPSGHAMSSAIVYGTVAYLAARLQREHAARIATLVMAFILILLISASRVYLGVHYPSDVIAGVVIGLGWAGFCMATLEATQLYARWNAPEMLKAEHPAGAPAPEAAAKAANPIAAGVEAGVEEGERREAESSGGGESVPRT
jgi:undecaprenyl-diphosphatase